MLRLMMMVRRQQLLLSSSNLKSTSSQIQRRELQSCSSCWQSSLSLSLQLVSSLSPSCSLQRHPAWQA